MPQPAVLLCLETRDLRTDERRAGPPLRATARATGAPADWTAEAHLRSFLCGMKPHLCWDAASATSMCHAMSMACRWGGHLPSSHACERQDKTTEPRGVLFVGLITCMQACTHWLSIHIHIRPRCAMLLPADDASTGACHAWAAHAMHARAAHAICGWAGRAVHAHAAHAMYMRAGRAMHA
eukprot:364592-Chlamydomonas_euryale.AAC.6